MPGRNNRQRDSELERIEIVDENLRGGFAQFPRYVLRAKGLSAKSKLVYAALLDYAWQEGSCFPGQVRLAADLDISTDSVQRALAELRACQLVDWRQRGLNQTNVYYILRLSDNPHWDTDQEGNRKLRFPDTAKSGFKKPQKRGTKNTQREHTQSEYTQYSNNFELLTQKSKNGTTFENSKKRDSFEKSDADHDESAEDEAEQGSGGDYQPLTPSKNSFTAIGEVLKTRRGRGRPKTASTSPKSASETVAGAPAGAKQGRGKISRPEPPAWLRQQITRLSDELHDPEHLESNIGQATNLFLFTGAEAGRFQERMNEAKSLTLRYDIEKRAEGEAGELGQRNKMAYFFKVLREVLGLKGIPASETKPIAPRRKGRGQNVNEQLYSS